MRIKRKWGRAGISPGKALLGSAALLAGLVAMPAIAPGVAGAKTIDEASGDIICNGPSGVLGSDLPITGHHDVSNWKIVWMVNGVDAADLTTVIPGDVVSVRIEGYETAQAPVHITEDEIIGESGTGGDSSMTKNVTATGTGTSNATFDVAQATVTTGGATTVPTVDQAGVQYLLVSQINTTLAFPPIENNDGQFNFTLSDVTFTNNGTSTCVIPAAAKTFSVRGIPIPKFPIPATDRSTVDAYYSAEADADTNTPHAVTIDVLANDTDPDGLGPAVTDDLDIKSIVVPPLNGTVDCGALPGNGPCTYTPNDGFSGTDVFSYEIVDADGQSNVGYSVITVVGNNAPIAAGASEMVPYGSPVGTPVSFNLSDTDPDGDGLVYNTTLVSGPDPATAGTIALAADGTYTYTPIDDTYEGPVEFTYEVCDTHTLFVGPGGETGQDDQLAPRCSVATVYLYVGDNEPPLVADDMGTVDSWYPTDTGVDGTDAAETVTDAGHTITIDVLANDSDPDLPASVTAPGLTVIDAGVVNIATLTFDSGVTANGGTVVVNPDGTIDYTPAPGFEGTDAFVYEVQDASGASSIAAVTITVVANQAPIAMNDNFTGTSGIDVAGDLAANDVELDGEALVYNTTPVTAPTSGTLVINADGTFTYTPNAGFAGTDVFVYEVCDDHALTAGPSAGTPAPRCRQATVVIDLENTPPVAEDDSANTAFNTVATIDLLNNDADAEDGVPTVQSVEATSAEGGTVVDNGDGTATYTPAAGFCGIDSFDYTVVDAAGETDTATAQVLVGCQLDDTDGDGIPDWVEVIMCGTTTCGDVATDTDGDGIPDWVEIMMCGTATCVDPAAGTDTDGDGIPDWVEIIVCGTATCSDGTEDTDGDGIPDWVEVMMCGTVSCASTDTDTDGDGIPDWIEIIMCGTTSCASPDTDTDGDGIPDWIEVIMCGTATCANGDTDTDGDGVPDYIEIAICGTATCLDSSTDSDGDGIPDWIEYMICGTATCADGTEDTDGNGIPDWQEIATCGSAGCMLDYLKTKPFASCTNTASFTIPGTFEYDIPNGFRSNTDIRIFMFSDPVLLYSGALPDTGKVTLSIPADTVAGKHKFVVIGVDDITGEVKIDGCVKQGELPKTSVQGATQTASTGTGTATSSPSSVTGSSLTLPLTLAAAALLLTGAALVLLRRRREEQ